MCQYSKYHNGAPPPKFNDFVLYSLEDGSAKDARGVKRTGWELNEIQPTVIYDMRPRWRPVGAIVQQEKM